MKYIA